MKQFIISLIVMYAFCGCYPSYSVYIRNNNNSKICFRTYPSIESMYSKESTFYDSILAIRINQVDGYGTYEIQPFKLFRLFSEKGRNPFVDQIPFNYIEFVRNNDTIKLKSKEEIFNLLKPDSSKHRNYYVDL